MIKDIKKPSIREKCECAHGDKAVWAAQDNKLHGCLDNVSNY